MDKEFLDNVMNCQCLQSIMDNGHQRNNSVTQYGDRVITLKALESFINFYNKVQYRIDVDTLIDSEHRYDREITHIKLNYCPICGLKTKNEA